MNRRMLWWTWGVAALFLSTFLGYALTVGDTRGESLRRAAATTFLPGSGSPGHYQIEEQCDLCHVPFSGVPQTRCLACHAEELALHGDAHGAEVFGPEHGMQLARIDALQCVTCHNEHQPEITLRDGVTVSERFCIECHGRIRQTSATHVDLTFDMCTGCHNYHDNSVLAESFLRAHGHQPDLLPAPRVPVRARDHEGTADLPPDHPARLPADPATALQWRNSAHATAGVNCLGCHGRDGGTQNGAWHEKPGVESCADCHRQETDAFLQSRKGMRIAAGLPPLRVGDARLSMRQAAADRQMDCTSCHDPHGRDTAKIQFDTCRTCHDSQHVQAHVDSAHHEYWRREQAGVLPPGSGVSCATCHFPRVVEAGKTHVMHNVNRVLRPAERMAGPVCLHCHGARFSIQALADRTQAGTGFDTAPQPRKQVLEHWLRNHGPLSAP